VRLSGADVIVCGIDDPSRDALDSMRALNRHEPRPVVLFSERSTADQIEAAIEAGVAAYVAEELAPERVRQVIDVAIRQFRAHQALRDRLARVEAEMEDRKVIERAKGLLMQGLNLNEDDAHRWLRRRAMDGGHKLAEMASMVLARKIDIKHLR
jgi:response regulator NasT